MFLDKIYKLTTKNKVQEWQIEVVDNKYRTITGQQDGKKVTSKWTTCLGKNLGKANATTPESQALLEATAERRKKLEKDYVESLDNITLSDFIQPMLAETFSKFKHKVTFPCFIQPKLDGVRCITFSDKALSRNNKKFSSIPFILSSIKIISDDKTIKFFDGELYNHDLHDNFNEIVSLVRKDTPVPEAENIIQYWVYDLMTVDTSLTFSERYALLSKLFNENNLPNCKLVPTYTCNSFEDIEKYFSLFIEENYEGAIVRLDSSYENKRSQSLLKVKDFIDEEFLIIDVIEGKGNRSGGIGKFILVTEENKEFGANVKGNYDYYSFILNNKKDYIGKKATVKYKARTPDNIPRHGVVIKIDRDSYE